jgi:lipopolysaccharide export LptBFGC system permease protein LptF
MLAQFYGAQVFEGAMLICFGLGWPVAILKTLRVKRVEGKSLPFLVLIFCGYLAGIVSKLFRLHAHGYLEPVTALYVLNAVMVGIEVLLYMRYRAQPPVETGG